MDIEKHKAKFDKIIKKYNLKDEAKAEEIANFLTSQKEGKVSAKDFAKLFAMTDEEAVVFLSYIHRGIRFKEEHIDPNNR